MKSIDLVDSKYCNSMRKLFPDWKGHLMLPQSTIQRIKIGSHIINKIHFRGGQRYVELTSLDIAGVFLIETNLQKPFNRMILRLKGGKKIKSEYCFMNEIIDEIWQYSRYYGDMLSTALRLHDDVEDYAAILVWFNAMELICKPERENYDQNFLEDLFDLKNKNIYLKKIMDFYQTKNLVYGVI